MNRRIAKDATLVSDVWSDHVHRTTSTVNAVMKQEPTDDVDATDLYDRWVDWEKVYRNPSTSNKKCSTGGHSPT